MNRKERRFSQRYDAAPLKVEVRIKKLFWGWHPPHQAIGVDIAHGGIAILSPLKIRTGKRLLLSLGNQTHRLNSVPAVILRQTARDGDFVYGVRFELDPLGPKARASAEVVLQRLLDTLQHTEWRSPMATPA